MAVEAGDGLGVLGEQLDEFEVEVLLVLARLATVPLVVQDGLVDSRRVVVQLFADEVLRESLLEVRVDLHVPGHYAQSGGCVVQPHRPLRKPTPNLLVLREREVPEGPVVDLPGFGYHLLLLEGGCVHEPDPGHFGEFGQSLVELPVQLGPLFGLQGASGAVVDELAQEHVPDFVGVGEEGQRPLEQFFPLVPGQQPLGLQGVRPRQNRVLG